MGLGLELRGDIAEEWGTMGLEALAPRGDATEDTRDIEIPPETLLLLLLAVFVYPAAMADAEETRGLPVLLEVETPP